jgi:hypothetical protein
MTFKSIDVPNKNNKCLYDLSSDSYPENLWFAPIPKYYLDVPLPSVPVNPHFSMLTGVKPNGGSGSGSGSASKSAYDSEYEEEPPCYVDCSGTALMQNLVTQFNQRHSDVKINKILRAWTPALNPYNLNDPNKNPPVCDYDAEMVRTNENGPITMASNETVRFYLKPTNPPSCDNDFEDPGSSGFDLDRDDSATPSSGLSLNASQSFGVLVRPFVWSSTFIHNVNSMLNDYILNMIGLDGPNVIEKISKNALTTINNVLEAASLTQSLEACPIAPCKDPYIL